MTLLEPLLDGRPRLRAGIISGPGLQDGSRVVHTVKDTRTGRYFTVGEREQFIMSRLDGNRSLRDIGMDYCAHFGRRIDLDGWHQILGQLAGRRLLAGTADEAELDALAIRTAAEKSATHTRKWWHLRLPLFNPDPLLTWCEPRLRWIFSPLVVVPALAATAGVGVWATLQAQTLSADVAAIRHDPAIGALAAIIIWLSVAIHELAHGLTSKHYGGGASEIGILWRLPILAPYCRVDDVALFARRRHRVYTAFAGTFATLLLLLPAAAGYLAAQDGSFVSHLSAAVLLSTIASAVINFIPFFRLDGYYMLNHALGMVNLEIDSWRYVTKRWRRRSPLAAAPPRHRKIAYICYSAGSLLAAAALLTWVVVVLQAVLASRWGPLMVGSGGAILGVIVARAVWRRRRS